MKRFFLIGLLVMLAAGTWAQQPTKPASEIGQYRTFYL